MRRFVAELAFDALDKRRTLNGNRFRLEIFSHFGLSQGLPVPIEELWPRIEDLLEELRRLGGAALSVMLRRMFATSGKRANSRCIRLWVPAS